MCRKTKKRQNDIVFQREKRVLFKLISVRLVAIAVTAADDCVQGLPSASKAVFCRDAFVSIGVAATAIYSLKLQKC